MQKKSIPVTRTAHYYLHGKPGKHVENLWIACHGYGQAAERFIKKFTVANSENTLIIAPEGLSRFYWGGFTGEVVASWMTSGDRLDEIDDFCNFLQTIYDKYAPQCADNVRITLFGFSQGVATIFRWAFAEKPLCHNIVLWAGSIPDELDYTPHHAYLSDKKLYFVYGTEDEFLTLARLEKLHALFAAKGMNPQEMSFEGKHRVDRDALLKLMRKMS